MEASSLYEGDVLLLTVHSLIRQFVERQSIVLEAIRVLRPDWIIRAEGRANKEFTKTEWQKFVLKCIHIPQVGYWGNNNEWEYFLHGIGCRMKHTITREPLDWDLGSLHIFHKSAFFHYVQWVLEQVKDKSATIIKSHLSDEDRALKKLISGVLEKLTESGVVKPNEWKNKYILIAI